jgi:hypothetical protein
MGNSPRLISPGRPPTSEGFDIPVRAEPLYPPRIPLGGRLLLTVVVVFAFSGEIHAATLSNTDSFDAAEHVKACKCGSKCRGASCCCGSRKSKPAPNPKAEVAPKSPLDFDQNPCLNSSPCRDPILPTSAPVGSSSKIAALGSLEPPPARVGRRMLAIPSSPLSSDRRASRLDRPPKASSLA